MFAVNAGSRCKCKQNQFPTHQWGLTLVELMISMTLGLFILAGVLQMYATSSQHSRANSGAVRIQENMRYAISRLEEDISQAGNAGCFSFMVDEHESEVSFSGVNENPKKNLILNILANQTGNDDWNHAISATNGDANKPDSLTLRYASVLGQIPISGVNHHSKYFTVDLSNPIHASTFNQLKQFDIVMAASCVGAMVFMITNDPGRDGHIAFEPGITSKHGQTNKVLDLDDDFFEKLIGREGEPAGAIYAGDSGSYTYSIGKAASATGDCSFNNPQNCALLLNDRELLDGVQNFQVEFGHQFGSNTHPDLHFVTADADSLTDNNLGWGSIDRIRVTMTFNSINNVPTNQGSQLMIKKMTRVFTVANQLMASE
jgi:type IV pilus assembly protein PilW